MPGHAGNFLTRLFSLSPETIPQMPIKMMQLLEQPNHKIPEDLNRLELYKFDDVIKKYNHWQTFHRSFPDYNNRDSFNLLNINSGFRHSHVIYSIHPHEFWLNLSSMCAVYDQFFHVELTDHDEWVNDQQQKLQFEWRENELLKLQQFTSTYPSQAISLTQMLRGNNELLNEYKKICQIIGITPMLDQALQLYQSWRSVRYPGK
jgi:hypothetical protein